MVKDKKVRELLVPITDYPCINADASVRDAFYFLKKNEKEGEGFRSIFVIDQEQNIKGHLSMKDLIQAVEPQFLQEVPLFQGLQDEDPELSLLWQRSFTAQCRKEARKPVKAVMKPVKVILTSEDPIAKAAYIMVNLNARVLPVQDKEKIAGVTRMVDVFREISHMVLEDD